jgi:hypothetical protein
MLTLGIFHTAVSVLPIGFGLLAIIRDRKIDLKTWMGKLYLITMFIGSVTALGFIPSRGFTPGEGLTVTTLGLLFTGIVAARVNWQAGKYVETISLSMSYLLLMVFTTTESLTRLPINNPFASGPTDSALLPVRLTLLALFVLGVGYQVWKIHSESRQLTTLRRVIAEYRSIVKA